MLCVAQIRTNIGQLVGREAISFTLFYVVKEVLVHNCIIFVCPLDVGNIDHMDGVCVLFCLRRQPYIEGNPDHNMCSACRITAGAKDADKQKLKQVINSSIIKIKLSSSSLRQRRPG